MPITTYTVASLADWNAAMLATSVGQPQAAQNTAYTISITSSYSVLGNGSGTFQAPYAINLAAGSSLTINGGGHTISNGGGALSPDHNHGFFVYAGSVTIQNVTLSGLVTRGGDGGDGDDTISGGGDFDTWNGGDGFDTSDLAYANLGVTWNMATGATTSTGFTATNLATNFEAALLGEGADTVTGNLAGNLLVGNGGADLLIGAAGNDTLNGGAGNDTIYGGAGSDYLFGNAGADGMYAGAGTDYIYSNAGNDIIYTDDVAGPQSRDFIYAGFGTGADTVLDFMAGDAANADVLVISPLIFANFAALQAATTQIGVSTVINLGGGDQMILYNVQPFQLTASNVIFI